MPVLDDASSGERAMLVARALREVAAGQAGDAVAAAHTLTRWSMRLLDVRGAGVMMADDRGVLRSMVVSSVEVRQLEAAELSHDAGPCVESHRRSETVVHADVDVADVRWPQFGLQASAAGMRGVHAVPVIGDGTAYGVLNLFRAVPGALSDGDSVLARSLADAAGAAVARRSTVTISDPAQLVAAVADAAVVERVTGMLAVRLEVAIDTAAAVLRQAAADAGYTAGSLAAAVLSGEVTIALPLLVVHNPPTPVTDAL